MSHRRHRASVLGRGYDNPLDDPPRLRFIRAIWLSFMAIVAPGSPQVFFGNRWIGRIALAFHVLLILTAVFAVWTFRNDRARALGWALSPEMSSRVTVVLIVGAIVWLVLFIDAWRIAHTDLLPAIRRGVVTVVNLAVITAVVLGTALSTQVMSVQRDVVGEVFDAVETSSPLNGRYNILLIGADSGSTRVGTRPDSLTIASVDASTGKTVLISIPRNLQNAQFPADSPMHDVWPAGFNCGAECLINAVWTDAESRPGLYPKTSLAGLEATIDAVEGSTGLRVNYYVRVNLQGFESLVEAVGGVKVDVKTRIAKFGDTDAIRDKWIEPGLQTLNGKDALWFARSRYGADDFIRSARQKCLMAAMLDQLDPQTVLLNASEIGKSSKELMSTNIPQSELGAFADLALSSRDQKIATVSLVPPAVNVLAPDFVAIREMIQEALDKTSGMGDGPTLPNETEPAESPSPPANGYGAGEPVGANQTDDLEAVC